MGKKSTSINPLLLLFLTVLALIVFVFKLIASALIALAPILLIAGSIVGGFLLIYIIYDFFYFKSKGFLKIKKDIKKYIDNSNELNHHINELRNSFIVIKYYD